MTVLLCLHFTIWDAVSYGFLMKESGVMIDISLNKIKKNYGFNDVLTDINFDVYTNDKIALVGLNGSGKSTILKLIYGIENPNSGNISIRNNISIGYLSQNYENKDILVKNMLYENFKDVLKLEYEIKKIESKMQTQENDYKLITKYCNLLEKLNDIGGYKVKEKITKTVDTFKLEKLLEKNFNILSGGEKKLVLLANIMINNPDVILLDEPTNYLDINTLEWLENYLINYKGSLVIVSHDRYFLDKVTNKTILIENGTNYIFHGNYSYYLKENENRIINEFEKYKDQQKQIEEMKKTIKKLREWGQLGNNERFFKRAKCIERRLEKIELINKPKVKNNIPITFNDNKRTGHNVLKINNLNLVIEDKILLDNVNFELTYGTRTCILGSNGSGKSTLIKYIINNYNNSKSTDNIKIGTNVKIGYIEQEIKFKNEDIRVYDEARKYFNGEEHLLRSSLFKFMFYGDDIYKKLNKLSGGERVRLLLFCLIQQEINFLILDEPTNHIDIETKEVLEDALIDFKGTILFVSHDRYFINKIATSILEIKDKKIHNHIGNYDDYKNYYK